MNTKEQVGYVFHSIRTVVVLFFFGALVQMAGSEHNQIKLLLSVHDENKT